MVGSGSGSGSGSGHGQASTIRVTNELHVTHDTTIRARLRESLDPHGRYLKEEEVDKVINMTGGSVPRACRRLLLVILFRAQHAKNLEDIKLVRDMMWSLDKERLTI